VVAAAEHGLVDVKIKYEEASDFNGVRADELPPAVVEIHLADKIEQHLNGSQTGQAVGHPQHKLVGLFPIDHRRELLGEARAQPIPDHAQVDGDIELKLGKVDGDGTVVVNRSGLAPLPHVFLADLGLGQSWSPRAILDTIPSILCRRPWLS
jgi:hypothetical protein